MLLDQPTPALVQAERSGDGPAARQAAVGAPIGVRQMPGLPLQIVPGQRTAVEAAARPADRPRGDTGSRWHAPT